RGLQDPDAVRAAINRHFLLEPEGGRGKPTYASAIELAGASSALDDPAASAFWLPLYETVTRQDSAYRRTVKGIDVTPQSLTQQCARLMGPDAASVLEWLRRAPLDGG